MHPLDGLAQQCLWAGKNTAYNLKFIPEEKLGWKPAPTANSAYEIIQHVVDILRSVRPVLTGGEYTPDALPAPTSLQEAQQQILAASEAYAGALRQVDPRELRRKVTLPWATAPLARAATSPVVDLIHHHGQIVYIQALLGDTKYHFFENEEQS